MTIPIRAILAAFGLTLLAMAAILALLAALGPDWSIYAPATCTGTRCFCELPRAHSLIVQPANSWSSYGYVFAGFLMIAAGRARGRNSAFPPLAATIFGVTAIAVGLGSVLLHATLTLWGQFFDVLGMYLVSGFMLASAIAKWRGIPDQQATIIYLVLCAVLVAILAALPEVRRWLYAVVLIAAIVVELGFARPRRIAVVLRFYLLGIVAKAVAFTIWNLDQNGQLCAPHSLLQGHAVWHCLGALALWFTYLYYHSERHGPNS